MRPRTSPQNTITSSRRTNHNLDLNLVGGLTAGFCTFTLLIALTSCKPKETKVLLQPAEALGTILAEETVRVAGAKKQVAIISHDATWGPTSSVEHAFKAALRKHGVSAVAAKPANLGDPMRSGQVGLKAADFFEVAERFPDAGAIVSLVGSPLLKPGDVTRLGSRHPPVLVVATAMLGTVPGVPTDRMELARLLDAKIIQFAIIDAAGPATETAGKPDATHQLFAQHYRILRRPD